MDFAIGLIPQREIEVETVCQLQAAFKAGGAKLEKERICHSCAAVKSGLKAVAKAELLLRMKWCCTCIKVFLLILSKCDIVTFPRDTRVFLCPHTCGPSYTCVSGSHFQYTRHPQPVGAADSRRVHVCVANPVTYNESFSRTEQKVSPLPAAALHVPASIERVFSP